MLLNKLDKANLIHPPYFLIGNVNYLTYMGSHAYGTNRENSDFDTYGWCFAPRDFIFPKNEIRGFDAPQNIFDQWSQHGIIYNDKEYDITVYNITRYFKLAANCTPNILDSLWTPENCVIQCSQIGRLVRDNRQLFLSKKIWHTLKGYSFSQIKKAQFKSPEGKRKEEFDKVGYDKKFLAHSVRLLHQCEQLLETGDMDLQLHKNEIKAILDGSWHLNEVIKWQNEKILYLDKLYSTTKLSDKPRLEEIRELLIKALGMHYSNLDDDIEQPDLFKNKLIEVDKLLNSVRGNLY